MARFLVEQERHHMFGIKCIFTTMGQLCLAFKKRDDTRNRYESHSSNIQEHIVRVARMTDEKAMSKENQNAPLDMIENNENVKKLVLSYAPSA